MSARTQTVLNAPALTITPADRTAAARGSASARLGDGAARTARAPRKLRKEDPNERDRGGNVLPPRSGSGYGQTNAAGEVVYGEKVNGPAVPRIQAAVENAKMRRRERQAGRTGNKRSELSKNNMIVDADGIAHDSEYVQFRTATPIHAHKRETENGYPDDDGSASSSASSASSSSGGAVGRYQSTRTTSAAPGTRGHAASSYMGGVSNKKHSHLMMTTASAIPPYRDGYVRSSMSTANSHQSLLVPRAPSPKRRSHESDHPGGYSLAAISRLRTGAPSPQFTTSSYQPPAPAISTATPRDASSLVPGGGGLNGNGSDVASLTSSMARTSLAAPDGAGGDSASSVYGRSRSGYDKYARGSSTRPPTLDGSAMDAGMHGMKRSFDAFKLDVKFGAYKTLRKLERKII